MQKNPQIESKETTTTEATTLPSESSIIVLDSNITSKNGDFSESENEDVELNIKYKLIIKLADGTSLPAKNQSVTISELDEFLHAIQNNVTTLLGDEKIYANDYSVSFRSEKGQGAGTLLIDIHDFKNFCSEYTKLVAAEKTMVIFVVMKKNESDKNEKSTNKRKKKG
jgi:hypothetical protein